MHHFPRTLLRRARRVLHRVLRGKRTARALLPESSLHADERAPTLLSASHVLAPLANDGDPIFPVELEQAIFKITAMIHPTTIPALLRVARRVGIWVLPASPVLAPLADIGDPIFPVELEQAIFEITAMMHPTTIPALLRVARRVGIWSVLLLVVRVSRRDNFNGIVRALIDGTKSRPAELLCTYVRHLTLESLHHCSFYEGRSLLQRCRKVIDFSSNLWFTNPSLLPILAEMHLERLSVNLKALFGNLPIDLNHPLFRSVTHLDMFPIEGVAELSRDIALSVLRDCPRLELLLVQWQLFEKRDYMAARTPHVYDIRFVIGLYGDYWADWEAGARGGADAWCRGDDFFRAKARGSHSRDMLLVNLAFTARKQKGLIEETR
ncbi:hypothetical protein B0H14DRAFT_3869555 [Mycena olivaceomarginata]|nr:hypothetical protein B0H14DRAFT_3869555 [Mycena olivaceomarginata]